MSPAEDSDPSVIGAGTPWTIRLWRGSRARRGVPRERRGRKKEGGAGNRRRAAPKAQPVHYPRNSDTSGHAVNMRDWFELRRILTPGDAALMLAVAAGALLAAWRQPPASAASVAVVEVEGREVAVFPLDQDGRQVLHARTGEVVIEIRDGAARFAEAGCRNRICVLAGWIEGTGEIAACVPNGMVLLLRGERSPKRPGGVDAFSG